MFHAPYTLYPRGLHSDRAELESVKFDFILNAANAWMDEDNPDAAVYDCMGVRIANEILRELLGE